MNPQAAELNAVLEAEGPAALRLLSQKGKNIFFPRKGLVAQGLEAKGKTINASIGEAKEDDGTPLRLSPLADGETSPGGCLQLRSQFRKTGPQGPLG
jgi:hypothetical protein